MEILKFIKENEDWKEKLWNDHGIKSKIDPEYPALVNLCYDQIACKKTHPLTIECRGLVIDQESVTVQSRPFERFFNYGEAKDYTKVNFDNCRVYEKLDGSLVTLYYSDRYKKWMVSTKGTPTMRNAMVKSPLDSNMIIPMIYMVGIVGLEAYDYMPKDITVEPKQEYLEIDKYEKVIDAINVSVESMGLDKSITYIFELTSPHINIVTKYHKTDLVLIGMIRTETGEDCYDMYSTPFTKPTVYDCSGIDEIQDALKNLNKDSNIIREGFVVQCLDTMTRVKIKNGAYLKIHKNIGKDKLNDDVLKDIVVDFEEDEILSYYPEYKGRISELIKVRDKVLEDIRQGFELANSIDDRKELALKLKNLGVASIIFPSLKKGIDHPYVAFSEASKKVRLSML